MHTIPRLFPLAIAISLVSGCTTNTRLDDDAYLPIGQQQSPQQLGGYAAGKLSDATGSQADKLAKDGIQVQGQAVPVPDFPGAMDHARLEDGNANVADNGQPVRYGRALIINQIVQTARIHCQPLQYRISTGNNSFWGDGNGILTQCTYQFPKFCGGHRFSILDYDGKEVLVYKPGDNPDYVIDTLKGTPKARPGLWDQDDHLGTSTTNAGYFLDSNYNRPHQQEQFNPASLGWIINASYQEQTEYGKLYSKAVEEITRCF